MSQYPGGVGARSHCARCRDTAWRCALTPAGEAAAAVFLVVESHSDGTRVGDDELHRGASSLGGNGPTAAYHYKKFKYKKNPLFFGWPKKIKYIYVATFLTLPRVQRVPVSPSAHDLIERERHAGVRHGVDLELRVDRRRRIFARPRGASSFVPGYWDRCRRQRRHRYDRRYVAPGALRRRRWRRWCRGGVLGCCWWARARRMMLAGTTFTLRRRGGVPERKRCAGRAVSQICGGGSTHARGKNGAFACLESLPASVTSP